MTWKSYAAVSGATVLAGWLASPSYSPTNTGASPAQTQAQPLRRATVAATDIEEQAARLQSRMRVAREYTEPGRNPFRFAPRTEAPHARTPAPDSDASTLAPQPIDLVPAAPQVTLSGIAEDRVESGVQRTAILSSPVGVLLVREGEEILGYYRVTRIESEGVELTAVGDGSTRRLTLGSPQPQ